MDFMISQDGQNIASLLKQPVFNVLKK